MQNGRTQKLPKNTSILRELVDSLFLLRGGHGVGLFQRLQESVDIHGAAAHHISTGGIALLIRSHARHDFFVGLAYAISRQRIRLLNGQTEYAYRYTISNAYKARLSRAPYYDGTLQPRSW